MTILNFHTFMAMTITRCYKSSLPCTDFVVVSFSILLALVYSCRNFMNDWEVLKSLCVTEENLNQHPSLITKCYWYILKFTEIIKIYTNINKNWTILDLLILSFFRFHRVIKKLQSFPNSWWTMVSKVSLKKHNITNQMLKPE
jgi:hypothetical protein